MPDEAIAAPTVYVPDWRWPFEPEAFPDVALVDNPFVDATWFKAADLGDFGAARDAMREAWRKRRRDLDWAWKEREEPGPFTRHYLLTPAQFAIAREEAARRGLDESFRVAAMSNLPVAPALDPGARPLWRPGGRGFGSRRDADRLIGLAPLSSRPEDGAGAVVFVVDGGLHDGYMARAHPGRLWGRLGPHASDAIAAAAAPRRRIDGRHGHMVARNVLHRAPAAGVVDVPLLPARITAFQHFLHEVSFAFEAMRFWASVLRALKPELAVVAVNAWAVYDTSVETAQAVAYSTNRGHDVCSEAIMAALQRVDMVFAAGNASRLLSDPRVGRHDGEPYRAIFGANGLPETLCVTSVGVDGRWSGTASRGPAPQGLGVRGAPPKPDVAAPAFFAESGDRGLGSTGSSAACAVATGALAAARPSRPDLPTADLLALVRETARRLPGQTRWTMRLGEGVLDARVLRAALAASAGAGPATAAIEPGSRARSAAAGLRDRPPD